MRERTGRCNASEYGMRMVVISRREEIHAFFISFCFLVLSLPLRVDGGGGSGWFSSPSPLVVEVTWDGT